MPAVSQGVYRMLHDTTTTQVDDIVKKDDAIRIEEGLETPIDNVLGVDIFQATHMKSQKDIYISTGGNNQMKKFKEYANEDTTVGSVAVSLVNPL